MNPNYKEFRFPQIASIPWTKVFKPGANKASINFLSTLLVYNPKKRPNPLVALLDPYFDELRDQNARLPDGSKLNREIFEFTE